MNVESRVWFIQKNGEKEGPFSHGEIQSMRDKKELVADSLLWMEGFDDWRPLSEIEAFQITSKYDYPIGKEDIEGPGKELGEVHPWMRFFARITDYLIWGIILGVFVSLLEGPPLIWRIFFLGFFVTLIWVFIEALLISTWGTTPGKWLFGITLRSHSGAKLNFSSGLNRALSVWFLGMAAGTPLCLITMIVGAVRLSNNKITSWDKRGEVSVLHHKMGWGKTLVVAIFFLIILWLIFHASAV